MPWEHECYYSAQNASGENYRYGKKEAIKFGVEYLGVSISQHDDGIGNGDGEHYGKG